MDEFTANFYRRAAIAKLRGLRKRVGSWAFSRYMRNQGYSLEFTLHVMFPQKYPLPC